MLFGKRGIVSIVGGLALMVAGLIGYFKYDEIVNGFDFFSTGNISHLPFLRTENGKWGMVGIDGSLLFEGCFDNEPTVVVNNRFYVKNKEGLWDLYSIDSSKPERVGQSSYRYAALFYMDVAPVVRPNHCIEIIDRNGRVLHQIDKLAGRQVLRISNFSEGLAVIELDNHQFGAVDTTGQLIIQPNYDVLYPCHDGRLIAHSSNKMVVLDKFGTEVFSRIMKEGFSHAPYYKDGSLAVMYLRDSNVKKWAMLNQAGYEIRVGDGDLVDFQGEMVIVKTKDHQSLLNVKGETILSVTGQNFHFASMEDRIWRIDATGRYHLIDINGREKGNAEFFDVLEYKNEYHPFYSIGDEVAVVSTGMGQWVLLNTEGRVNKEYYSLGSFNLADCWIYNEQIDLDYLISQLLVSSRGLDGLTFDSPASEVALKSGDTDARNYTDLYDIRYVKPLGKGAVTIVVDFSDQVGYPDGTFTDMTPDYFEVRFDETGIFYRKKNEIFEALNRYISHLHGVEHIENQGENAIVYRFGDRVSCVVYRNQFGVYLMMSLGEDSESEMKEIAQDGENEQLDDDSFRNEERQYARSDAD